MLLCICGAGGFGREVLELARCVNEASATSQSDRRWSEIFFAADKEYIRPSCKSIDGARVLSFDEAFALASPLYETSKTNETSGRHNVEFIIALGEPRYRKQMFDRIQSAGFSFANLIHPDVVIPATSKLSEAGGCIICRYVHVGCAAFIGCNVVLQPFSLVGHDCQVGSHSVVSSFAAIAGHCQIGSETYIGQSASIKENTVIGNDCIVGMGSIVRKNVADSTVVAPRTTCTIQKKPDWFNVFSNDFTIIGGGKRHFASSLPVASLQEAAG